MTPSPGWAARYRLDPASGVRAPEGGPTSFDYSDGDVEDRLLQLLRATSDLSLFSTVLAGAVADWATRYHLSPLRANALRPLASLLKGRTLEIGSGCGAVTRYLGELGGSVVAVEGSLRRAAITAARCADLPNVAAYCDTLAGVPGDERFDAVTLVGVLEWTPAYGVASDGDPVQAALERAAGLLNPGGSLVLAIENQLGLKYFAGFAEDHVGQVMHGIEDLYQERSPITFGRVELLARLRQAGFAHAELFLPLPDYKLATTVVTPSGIADETWLATLTSLLVSSASKDRQPVPLPLFSLEQAWRVVARNGLVADLANSFLIVARREPPAADARGWDRSALAFHYGSARRGAFAKETAIRSVGGVRSVCRQPLAGTVAANAGDVRPPVRPLPVDEPFLEGELWSDRLLPIVNRANWTLDELVAWARPWVEALAAQAGGPTTRDTLLPGRFVDATPFNVARGPDGTLRFFDLEWDSDEPVSLGFVVFRGLFYALARAHSVAPPEATVPRRLCDLARGVSQALGLGLEAEDVERHCEREAAIQAYVTGEGNTTPESIATTTLRIRPRLAQLAAGNATAPVSQTPPRASAGPALLARLLLLALRPGGFGRVLRIARSGLFDPRFYATRYPDAAGVTPLLLHYLVHGEAEGRAPNALFDAGWYAGGRGTSAVGRALTDYLSSPAPADPHPLFRTAHYLARRGSPLEAGTTPLADYLQRGAKLGLSPHPLFAPDYYLEHNPDVRHAGLDPLLHYLLHGGREGRDPHPAFDSSFYLDEYPDVKAAGVNPLVHYLVDGAAERRDPSPRFSTRRYLRQHPEALASGLDPLSHSLQTGS